FEQGANDNSVGVAAVIEAARLIRRMVSGGLLPRPKRSIDVQISNEVLSTLAFYRSASRGRVDNWPKRFACGLNLDSCGFASREDGVPMAYSSALPGAAPYVSELMVKLLNCAKTREPWLAWSEKIMPNDGLMISDPMLGAPTTLLGHQHHVTYHTDGDNIEGLDHPTIKLVTALTAAFAYAAASADAADVYRGADGGAMPEEFTAHEKLRRVAKRLVWGPLFLSARKLPDPFNKWFGWNSRGLIPLYLMDGRRSLAEVFHLSGVAARDLDEYTALADALADADIIKLE
ncbi:MAG: M28 family peptidase, partial [Planctomycetes bacterium]|nr:M28 family peptidase [Planctomycetota bacterium]